MNDLGSDLARRLAAARRARLAEPRRHAPLPHLLVRVGAQQWKCLDCGLETRTKDTMPTCIGPDAGGVTS